MEKNNKNDKETALINKNMLLLLNMKSVLKELLPDNNYDNDIDEINDTLINLQADVIALKSVVKKLCELMALDINIV